jgi:hypothetical protein
MKNIVNKILCFLGFHRWCGFFVGCSLMRRCTVCGKKEIQLVRLFLTVKK